ncbi:MAG: DUF3450 family protein [Acidobacteriota bacterium]|nr:DUF3450 family protein [Acidobacteriota bacterium]MDQ7087727.1 DUF3450 family protein [Acidobacteriota bacterium]
MNIRDRIAILVTAALVPAAAAAPPADGGRTTDLEETRARLAKWVETQQVIAREKRDWKLGKEVLTERISILERQIAALDQKIEEAEKDLAEVAGKERELAARERELDRASVTLARRIPALEKATRALLDRLPDPLREKVSVLSRRLPRPGGARELSPAERYQNVIGILNEVNKFQREINLVSEIRELPSGKRAEVQTVYAGLGQAWYVTRDGSHAGLGRSGPDGWRWIAADPIAPQVTRLVKILENEEAPAYVPLPVTIVDEERP